MSSTVFTNAFVFLSKTPFAKVVDNVSEGELLFLVSDNNFLAFEVVGKVCKFFSYAVGQVTSPVMAFIPR